jgi:hypothetical protein
VPTARAEDGRWFVQSMGAFQDLDHAVIDRPAQFALGEGQDVGVRIHVLNDFPTTAYLGRTPAASIEGRASLVSRRRSEDGSAMKTTFVTLVEPLGRGGSIRRAGRVASPPNVIVIAVETDLGIEYVAINKSPGDACEAILLDKRVMRTDGLAVRVSPAGLTLAGGSFAEAGDRTVNLDRITGTVVAAGQSDRPGALGVFRVSDAIPKPASVVGRVLLIRHGDGSSRGWTIVAAENLAEGGSRLHVREESGMHIDPESGSARYERFPGTLVPGPHRFGVSRIAR